eukprot:9274399-Pyramimonas_sp.AAC.1
MGTFHHAGVAYNGDLYAFGGATANKTYSNQLLVARALPAAEAAFPGALAPWAVVEVTSGKAPSPRHSHTAVLFDDAMWVFGGQRALHAFSEVRR